MIGLCVGHGRMTGKAQLLGMDALCDGKDRVFCRIIVSITLLLMRWYGIVDFGLYTVVGQILAQGITALAENREDVVDRVAMTLWNPNSRISHLIYIYRSYHATALVVGLKITEFGVKDSSLQFIHAGVAAKIVEDVMTCRTVIPQCANNGSEFVIVGSHCASITESTEVLGRVEGMGSGVAKGACFTRR